MFPCEHDRKGICKFGSACTFAHGKKELQKYNPAYKTKECEFRDNCTRKYCWDIHTCRGEKGIVTSKNKSEKRKNAQEMVGGWK